jgi:hypothetical protein
MSIRRAARWHFDKHLIKMILELTQLLSTAWHILDPEKALQYQNDKLIYKKTHINHPCNLFTRAHINNYTYVAKLALALCDEWRLRYNHNKTHACEPKLLFMLKNIPPINKEIIVKSRHNPKMLLGPYPKCMPEEFRVKGKSFGACIRSYRKYYKSSYKSHLVSWTKKRNGNKVNCKPPPWW